MGLGLALSVTLVFISALQRGLLPDEARAMGLVTLIAGQMALVLIERAEYRPVWSIPLRRNKAIVPVILGTAAMLAVALMWPPVTGALHLATISPMLVLAACGIGCASVLWMQPFLALLRRSPEAFAAAAS